MSEHLDVEYWYLELSEGTAHKFYEITREANYLTIRYGRIGDPGQTQQKMFADTAAARAEAAKKLLEKYKSGYADALVGERVKKSTRYKRMTLEQVHSAFEPWREKYHRPTWFPIFEDTDGTLIDSKFGGTPALLPDEEIPRCSTRGTPMQLILQLNLDQLPTELAGQLGQGLIQIFLSLDFDATEDDEAFFEKAVPRVEPTQICRLIALDQIAHEPVTLPIGAFSGKRITGWTRAASYPHVDEYTQHGIDYESFPENEEEDIIVKAACEEFNVRFVSDDDEIQWEISPDIDGCRLWGHPAWYGDKLIKICNVCAQPMRMIFEFETVDMHMPVGFGWFRKAQLMQCENHKDQMGLIW
jgi:predicted DNA-binding WGR domain protein